MSSRPASPAALLRGGAAGALTAALAVAAHAVAGGAVPSGAAAVVLAVLSAGLGAVAGSAERIDPRTLIGLLAAGQLVDHLTLAAAGHSHAGALHPAMLVAHPLAILVGALLIAGAERLCRALATAAGTCALPRPRPAVPAQRRALPRASHPLQSRLLIAVSISHRGPPAALC